MRVHATNRTSGLLSTADTRYLFAEVVPQSAKHVAIRPKSSLDVRVALLDDMCEDDFSAMYVLRGIARNIDYYEGTEAY